MKIKNWIEAIDLTIERHQAVIDGKYKTYGSAKLRMKQNDWSNSCPLCAFNNTQSNECSNCPWKIIEEKECIDSPNGFNFNNDKQSIIRLNRWKDTLQSKNIDVGVKVIKKKEKIMEYEKRIRIFEIKDNINLPIARNPKETANCGIGDKLISFDDAFVYAKNWTDEAEFQYVLLSFNFAFVVLNKSLFEEIN